MIQTQREEKNQKKEKLANDFVMMSSTYYVIPTPSIVDGDRIIDKAGLIENFMRNTRFLNFKA